MAAIKKNHFYIAPVDAFKCVVNGRKEPTFRFTEQRLTNLRALRNFCKSIKILKINALACEPKLGKLLQ